MKKMRYLIFCLIFLFLSVIHLHADSLFDQNILSLKSKNLEKAEMAYIQGDFKKAYDFYDQALKGVDLKSSSYYAAQYWMGTCLVRLGRYKEARDSFALLLGQDKDIQVFGYYGMGESYLSEERLNKAKHAFDNLIDLSESQPSDLLAMAYYRRGTILEKLGQNGKAQENFELLNKKFPRSYPSLASKTFYFVQAGAFQNRKNATRLKEALSAKGYPCHIEMIDSDGKRLHRVRIGKYRSLDQARRALKQFQDREKIKATLMKESNS